MKRNFPDFLSGYAEFAKNDIVPDSFHFWTGVSLIAGALERKVWATADGYTYFPNLYVMLVARPGRGKTSAGNLGMTFLEKLGGDDLNKQIKFIAQQMSEAALIDQMKAAQKIIPTASGDYLHSSAYFYAPEASMSLSEIAGGGSFINTLLNLYDSPSVQTKELRTEKIVIRNACLNILACTTFEFLSKLLPTAIVGNGFASRLMYVVEDGKFVRRPKWDGSGLKTQEAREALLQDLEAVHAMQGSFRVTPEYKKLWEEFYPENDEQVNEMKSEKNQEFVSRRITNLTKLSMVVSAAESSDLVLDAHHWERARELIAGLESKLSGIMRNSASKADSKGMTYHILHTLQTRGGELPREEFISTLIQGGIDVLKIDITLKSLHNADALQILNGAGGKQRYRLLANPEDYL